MTNQRSFSVFLFGACSFSAGISGEQNLADAPDTEETTAPTVKAEESQLPEPTAKAEETQSPAPVENTPEVTQDVSAANGADGIQSVYPADYLPLPQGAKVISVKNNFDSNPEEFKEITVIELDMNVEDAYNYFDPYMSENSSVYAMSEDPEYVPSHPDVAGIYPEAASARELYAEYSSDQNATVGAARVILFMKQDLFTLVAVKIEIVYHQDPQ